MYFVKFCREGNLIPSTKKPYLGIHASHNIFDDGVANSKGIVEYDILVERPISESNIVETVFLRFSFPTPIEKFDVVNSVGTKNLTVKEGNKTTFLVIDKEQKEYSNDLIIEDDTLKPGCFLRVKVYSPIMENRRQIEKIICSGYYNYRIADISLRQNISLTFNPRFQKIMEIDLRKWQMIQELIEKITPTEGSLVFWTNDPNWLERNNAFIDFIPYVKKENFSLRIFRDKDHVFKCEISNLNYPKVILKYGDLERIKQGKKHPDHMIALTWKEKEKKLYLDGVLVDSFPK